MRLIAENNNDNTRSTPGNIYFAKKGPEVGLFKGTEPVCPRPLMVPTQQGGCAGTIRRTPQDKGSLPLLLLNTSAIDLVQKHSSSFPQQTTAQLEKLIRTEHPHVASREVPGWVAEGRKAWRAFPITWISKSSGVVLFLKHLWDCCWIPLSLLACHVTLHRLDLPLPENGMISSHTVTGQLQGFGQSREMERATVDGRVWTRPGHTRSAWRLAHVQSMLGISNIMETCQSPLKINRAFILKAPKVKFFVN